MRPAPLLGLVAPHCPRCGAPGPCRCDEQRDRETDERRARRQARQLELARRDALARIGWAWTDDREVFERAVSAPSLRAVSERWTPDRGSLLVHGVTGSGKTAASARGLRRNVRAATSLEDLALGLVWASAADLAHARRRHRIGAGEAPAIEAAIGATILVVDELGPEPVGDAIPEVFDARYRRGAVTITTSGMRLEELAAKYGDAVLRRLTAPVGARIEVWT
ncbi:MAG: ATP-binding protein [Myxococcales bacterium]|nr:ATP-binding protein [Myxococcales bacterium]